MREPVPRLLLRFTQTRCKSLEIQLNEIRLPISRKSLKQLTFHGSVAYFNDFLTNMQSVGIAQDCDKKIVSSFNLEIKGNFHAPWKNIIYFSLPFHFRTHLIAYIFK